MKKTLLSLFVSAVLFGFTACSPTVDLVSTSPDAARAMGGSDPTDPTDPGPGPNLPQFVTFYVNGSTGNNNNPGTKALPFLTIKKGLESAAAAGGGSVRVQPGTYSNASGETFPISVPEGVNLIGDMTYRGNGAVPTILSGKGTSQEYWPNYRKVTVLLHGHSQFSGFRVTAGSRSAGGYDHDLVVCLGEANRVSYNTIYNGYDGIIIGAGSKGYVMMNAIENTETGIRTDVGPGSNVKATVFRQNSIRYNQHGTATYFQPGGIAPDFGGGASGSIGQNVFAWNVGSDMYLGGGATSVYEIYAQNNFWSTVSPVGKIQAFDLNLTPVLTQGAQQAPNTPQVW